MDERPITARFKDGEHVVPVFAASFLHRLDTEKLTFEEAMEQVSRLIEADYVRRSILDRVATHLRGHL